MVKELELSCSIYKHQIFWGHFCGYNTTLITSMHAKLRSRNVRHYCVNGACARMSSFTWSCRPTRQSVERAGWQAKMASIEYWIPWRPTAHRPHSPTHDWSWLLPKHTHRVWKSARSVNKQNWYSQFWLVRNSGGPGKMCLPTEIMQ